MVLLFRRGGGGGDLQVTSLSVLGGREGRGAMKALEEGKHQNFIFDTPPADPENFTALVSH